MDYRKLFFISLGMLLLVLIVALTASLPGSVKSAYNTLVPVGEPLPQQIRTISLEGNFHFAGEALPMDVADIRERLEREILINSYLHASTLLKIKRTSRYFPEIERILREEGMPDDLKYLAVAESALENATSSAGAKGIWQFMEATGKAYGLEINKEIDERYHLDKATRAACQYLREYHGKFGSWLLAASGYNMGGPRLTRQMAEQRAASFDELELNAETSRYIFRIVALKTILDAPDHFGFNLLPEDYYPPFDNYTLVEVNGPIANWGDFAREHGTNFRQLKIYNPWILGTTLTNKERKRYSVRVPR
jgi:membrane-bound lytic murein transglycosylase D